ncbi:hypothetical protein [Streptomyces smyrnaeus]|uniref:hypothetical protein n=1 Tax=Streptomyces smyrnaeus TaxID=1387713 RepID=UPI0033D26024
MRDAGIRLAESHLREEPLGRRLALAAQVELEARCYAAAAVQDARRDGATWEDVAQEAGQSAAAVRARWGPARAERLMRDRLEGQEESL